VSVQVLLSHSDIYSFKLGCCASETTTNKLQGKYSCILLLLLLLVDVQRLFFGVLIILLACVVTRGRLKTSP